LGLVVPFPKDGQPTAQNPASKKQNKKLVSDRKTSWKSGETNEGAGSQTQT